MCESTKKCLKFALTAFKILQLLGDFVPRSPDGRGFVPGPRWGTPAPDPCGFAPSQTSFRRLWLIGTGSTAAQASGCPLPALTDFGPAVMQPAGILRPNQHARPSPRNPCT